MNHSVRRLTRCAVLTALALAISVCEGLVPLTVLIPPARTAAGTGQSGHGLRSVYPLL